VNLVVMVMHHVVDMACYLMVFLFFLMHGLYSCECIVIALCELNSKRSLQIMLFH
jgi:hypothetical protein